MAGSKKWLGNYCMFFLALPSKGLEAEVEAILHVSKIILQNFYKMDRILVCSDSREAINQVLSGNNNLSNIAFGGMNLNYFISRKIILEYI